MVGTGVAHKVISILLRLGELASAIIVLGILSRFCYLISIAEVYADGRIIYGIVVACLGIIYSFIFCPPFKNMFLGFPFDFVIELVVTLALQGVYVFRTYIKIDETKREIRRQAEKLTNLGESARMNSPTRRATTCNIQDLEKQSTRLDGVFVPVRTKLRANTAQPTQAGQSESTVTLPMVAMFVAVANNVVPLSITVFEVKDCEVGPIYIQRMGLVNNHWS
uniref:Uncharacterized protein n=1 Tax=Fusarium oxysporum (strain Fo5176) TaxID=660025 RepID=A0A0D2XT55_FUSOF